MSADRLQSAGPGPVSVARPDQHPGERPGPAVGRGFAGRGARSGPGGPAAPAWQAASRRGREEQAGTLRPSPLSEASPHPGTALQEPLPQHLRL